MKLILLLLSVVLYLPLAAQEPDREWVEKHYTKSEYRIPMRDGITLYTAVYLPDVLSAENSRPMMMLRTPYGCKPYGPEKFTFKKEFRNYYLDHYIIVLQDVRGRFNSEGEFLNVEERPEDTYDTVEWLLHNVPYHNGRVGVTGSSYPGYYALIAGTCGHPAVKAVAPQAPVFDWYLGDDVHHNGALMLLDTYFFGRSFYRHCPNPTTAMPPVVNKVDCPVYDFFLDKMTFRAITETFPEPLDFWNKLAEHPDYDPFWQHKTPVSLLHDLKPAFLIVGGSYDTDDCYGALQAYRTICSKSSDTEVHLVYGMWYHGTWRSSGYYLDHIEYPFFRRHLEGKGEGIAPVIIIPSEHSRGAAASPSGSNEENAAIKAGSWPLPTSTELRVFLSSDNLLSEKFPSATPSFSTYTNDPFDPVPSYGDEIWKRERKYMLGDQRYASRREDVLTFRSQPLEDTLKLCGPVKVNLKVSTSGEDGDFIVKIIDEAPDGYQMLVRWDVLRGRYRKGFNRPVPMVPEKITEIAFPLNDIAHHLLPGHRLTVQVQSTFFPVVDLNPGNFLPNIYLAEKKDFKKTRVNIYHDATHPSYLEFTRIVK